MKRLLLSILLILALALPAFAQDDPSIITVNGSCTVALPAAATASGVTRTIVADSAGTVKVKPYASEIIVLNGVALTGGYIVTSTLVPNDTLTLACDGEKWTMTGVASSVGGQP